MLSTTHRTYLICVSPGPISSEEHALKLYGHDFDVKWKLCVNCRSNVTAILTGFYQFEGDVVVCFEGFVQAGMGAVTQDAEGGGHGDGGWAEGAATRSPPAEKSTIAVFDGCCVRVHVHGKRAWMDGNCTVLVDSRCSVYHVFEL